MVEDLETFRESLKKEDRLGLLQLACSLSSVLKMYQIGRDPSVVTQRLVERKKTIVIEEICKIDPYFAQAMRSIESGEIYEPFRRS